MGTRETSGTIKQGKGTPYTNAYSLGNKQEELEQHVQSPNSITGIAERQWKNLHGCSAAVDGCKLNRKHRQRLRRIGLPHTVKEQLGHIDLFYGRDDSMAESLAESEERPVRVTLWCEFVTTQSG